MCCSCHCFQANYVTKRMHYVSTQPVSFSQQGCLYQEDQSYALAPLRPVVDGVPLILVGSQFLGHGRMFKWHVDNQPRTQICHSLDQETRSYIIHCKLSKVLDTICHIFFNQRPPSVVAPNSVPIHQFTFECDGTETNLTDCLTEELPFILNFHLLDVFITCFTSK